MRGPITDQGLGLSGRIPSLQDKGVKKPSQQSTWHGDADGLVEYAFLYSCQSVAVFVVLDQLLIYHDSVQDGQVSCFVFIVVQDASPSEPDTT